MTPNQVAYRKYLESDHWRTLRAEAYRVHGRKCFKCPRTFGLEVHHLRYRHPWTDCTVEDVRPCCWQCHDKEHGIVREIPLPEKRTIERGNRRRNRRVGRQLSRLLDRKQKRQHQWHIEQARYSMLMKRANLGEKLKGKAKRFLKNFHKTTHYSTPAVKGRPRWVNRGNSSN